MRSRRSLVGRLLAVLPAALVASTLAVPAAASAAGSPRSVDAGRPVLSASSGAADWGATPADPCDALDPSGCMLPFPSDYYTVADSRMPTGRRIYFPPGAFPAAVGAGPVDPAPWEANDGFSPGDAVLVHVPGIDLAASGVATVSDIGRSLDENSPVVLLDVTTGQRWPTWSELDARDRDPATRLLMIHPARNLTEGDRYIVALRDLRGSGGEPVPPALAFATAVLGHVFHPPAGVTYTPLPGPEATHLRSVVAELARHGISSNGLYLAWDFTVASRQNLTAPALDMRDRVLGQLGHVAPRFTVTKVVDDPPGDPSLAREVTGTFDVPSFLTGPAGVPGSVLETGPGGLPEETGRTEVAAFNCEIPKKATAAHPAGIGIYGHGLFGSSIEVDASDVPQFSNAYDEVFCGTDWYGLSSNSLPLASTVVSNLAEFPALVDSLLQSLLDAQVLGRLLEDPGGFAADPAFEDAHHRPLIDRRSPLVYYGNSEGGIMGGAFTALSTDVHRSVLGVPGMDYEVLLTRSADFAPFLPSLDKAYPSEAVQQLGYDLIQMLWDRGEADGYAEQMTGGLPGTPSHQVLLEEAFGDHQVANIATEDEARTIGAALLEPALAAGRSNERQPFWGLRPLRPGSRGPALTVWDSGVPPAPLTDTPPTQGPDPHDTVPRDVPAFWRQMSTFFATGRVIDPCGSRACRAPYPGG
ncbi:MAG: hypothetical protein ACYCU7_04410 [Acidimicrobiales bacterium]